ncbi:hypothetical protein ACHQM5_002910 [Ranunculus cassubicifolius]
MVKRSSSLGDQDTFSNLPESIIHHILSFLDMKYVVKTCVLSKAWKYIWVSVPNLEFNYKLHSSVGLRMSPFICFVDQVLLLHDDTSIQKFHLILQDMSNAAHIRTWIRVAIMRNVQELDLDISEQERLVFELPPSVFTCNSLRTLNVTHQSSWPSLDLKMPCSVSLPMLRNLQLTAIRFCNEKLIADLFSSCPVLETLIISYCGFSNTRNLNISANQLKELVIENCFSGYDELSELKIKVSAPRLESIRCIDVELNEFNLENLQSLVKADIDIAIHTRYDWFHEIKSYCKEKEPYGVRVINILGGLSTAKILTLSTWSIQFLSEVLGRCQYQLTSFKNLRYLKVTTFCTSACLRAATWLLQSFSNLRIFSMVIDKKCCSTIPNFDYAKKKLCSSYHDEQWRKELPSQCTLHYLKYIRIRKFLGCQNEIDFLIYLMNKAVNLERLIITSSHNCTEEKLRGIHALLLNYHCAFPHVAIFFFREASSELESSSEEESSESEEENTGSEQEGSGSEEENSDSEQESSGSEEEHSGAEQEGSGSDEENPGSNRGYSGSELEGSGTEQEHSSSEDNNP